MAGDETPVIIETITIGWKRSATTSRIPTERPDIKPGYARTSVPALSALGLPGARSDGDDRQSRRGTLLHLVGVVGNDPEVQRKARELAVKYVPTPARFLDAGRERAAGRRRRRRRRALRTVSGAAAEETARSRRRITATSARCPGSRIRRW
jgi:hypothetical protein